jgi:hypothetical protein
VGVIVEYLHLWNILCEVVLQLEVRDSQIWRLPTNGHFSVKLAYEVSSGVQFNSSLSSGFRGSGPQPSVHFFSGWYRITNVGLLTA